MKPIYLGLLLILATGLAARDAYTVLDADLFTKQVTVKLSDTPQIDGGRASVTRLTPHRGWVPMEQLGSGVWTAGDGLVSGIAIETKSDEQVIVSQLVVCLEDDCVAGQTSDNPDEDRSRLVVNVDPGLSWMARVSGIWNIRWIGLLARLFLLWCTIVALGILCFRWYRQRDDRKAYVLLCISIVVAAVTFSQPLLNAVWQVGVFGTAAGVICLSMIQRSHG